MIQGGLPGKELGRVFSSPTKTRILPEKKSEVCVQRKNDVVWQERRRGSFT